ncbi:hypothetical protein IAT40_001215 [Kwoniella sp. CBS 6097]
MPVIEHDEDWVYVESSAEEDNTEAQTAASTTQVTVPAEEDNTGAQTAASTTQISVPVEEGKTEESRIDTQLHVYTASLEERKQLYGRGYQTHSFETWAIKIKPPSP